MNGRIRFSLATLFAALIFSAITAAAQPLAWNPPCATLRIKNVTASTVVITLVTTPPGLIPPTTLAPFTAGPNIPVPVGTTVNSVISNAGFVYGVVQPAPPSPPAPIAANAWIPGVVVPGPPPTCVDLYLDLLNCTVYIFAPGTAPCRP